MRRWLLPIAAVLAVGMFAGGLITKVVQNSESIRNSNQVSELIVQAQVTQCEDDHKARVQYRTRARVERATINVLAGLLKHFHVGGVRQSVTRLRAAERRIHILPVPDCTALAAQLREALP